MKTFSDTEIRQQLKARLPAWGFEEDCLVRRYKTSGWKSTLMLATTLGHFSEVAWHHPELRLTYSALEVRLNTHSAKGITELDFELATKMEELVSWTPGEGSSLSGTPENPKYAHLVPDQD